MSFDYSRRNLSKGEKWLERFFEMIPGLASWSIILSIILLSVWFPVAASVIVMAFLLYWLLRIFYLTIFLVLAYVRLSVEGMTDWNFRLSSADEFLEKGAGAKLAFSGRNTLQERISFWFHTQNMMRLSQKLSTPPPRSRDVRHLVLLPLVNESPDVVRESLESIAAGRFSASQILVVLAVEGRAPEAVQEGARQLQSEFQGRFLDFLISTHPDGLPGEARVKGANITWAAREAARYLEARKIPFEHVIVSCFDSDTVVHPDYFSVLTYSYITCPERERASFQPIPVYYNNIWDVPGFARVLEMGASFFQLIEATNPEKLVTFSSHSMSFKALVEVGYWPVDIISDDSAIFWKSWLHYNGDYRVIPMYTTVSMDVIRGRNWLKTVSSLYRQKRRWAWGVENFPIVMRGFLKKRKIPFYDKLRYGFKLFEGHLTWATLPLLLTFIGWLPALAAEKSFANTVLYYSSGRITGTIFSISTVALVCTIVLSLCLLPKKKSRHSLFRSIIHALEWLLLPVIFVLFSAFPALDAQTRLMFGKYMEFYVSSKRK